MTCPRPRFGSDASGSSSAATSPTSSNALSSSLAQPPMPVDFLEGQEGEEEGGVVSVGSEEG